ncbi:MAG: acyl-CoA desaturase [Phycisphaerales bacterium]
MRSSPADRKLRYINLGAVLIPIAGLVAAMILAWGSAFNWLHLGIFVLMSTITSFGITVGYHRLCTHKSFETPAFMRYLFAAAGSMAAQGPVIQWCGEHRRHHQHSDTEGDPHSPHMSRDGSWGEGLWATIRGAYHAHMGWLFEGHSRGLGRYTRDLRADRALVAADRQFRWWVLAGLIIPAALGGLLTMTWMGALLGFLWGGLVRVMIVHHITWSVNSVCHLWGSRPFRTRDESRNNPVVGILALGEGWHNNHHAFPASARHGLKWWEVDFSYMLIRVLALVGLAKEVRVPASDRIETKRRKPPATNSGTAANQ